MNIIQVADYKELSSQTGKLIIDKVRKNPNIILGLATGSTPQGVYHYLINDHIESGTSYQRVTSFNLDEYIGLPITDSNSYHHFMQSQLFEHIDIAETYIPNGNVMDLDQECIFYENLIKEREGIDLQLLGIGENGHIGFNEPGTPFNSQTHIVTLSESTRKANSRFFQTIEKVPKHAITMGIATILGSKEIFLLASGSKKAKAVARLLTEDISEDFPASSLKKHQKVTIIADDDALKYV